MHELYGPRHNSRKRAPAQLIGGLRIVSEGGARTAYASVPILSPADAVALMAPLADAELTEVFWLLALNAKHFLISGAPFVITRGILNTSLVHPREVFRPAIVVGAAAVIIAHNHPSGDPDPSPDDKAVTDQLAAAGRVLDIPVHDHLILGSRSGRSFSFSEAGLM